MEGLYNSPQKGDEAVFVIHAFVKFGKNSTGEHSSDFVPKGTVTLFVDSKKGGEDAKKVVSTYGMYVEIFDGSKVKRREITPEKVDPMVKLTEQIAPETRRNPNHAQGPYDTQTQARSVAKVMAERGEDVYMWYALIAVLHGFTRCSKEHTSKRSPRFSSIIQTKEQSPPPNLRRCSKEGD